MPIGDICYDVFAGEELRRQLLVHDFQEIVTGEQFCPRAMRHLLHGQSYRRDHRQRPEMVARLL